MTTSTIDPWTAGGLGFTICLAIAGAVVAGWHGLVAVVLVYIGFLWNGICTK